MLRIAKGTAFAALMISASVSVAADFPQPLPEEPVPTVSELPDRYPASWVFVHDLHFNSLPDGRAALPLCTQGHCADATEGWERGRKPSCDTDHVARERDTRLRGGAWRDDHRQTGAEAIADAT